MVEGGDCKTGKVIWGPEQIKVAGAAHRNSSARAFYSARRGCIVKGSCADKRSFPAVLHCESSYK